MLTHREFSAWIASEGKPLREYQIAVDKNASKVSCWIPSEAGKSFSVRWGDVPGRFLNGYGEASREGVRTGSNTERPFVFMEQSSTPSEGRTNPDAGTVVLKIRLVAIEGARPANKIQQLSEPSGSQSNVSSHYIGYGEERHAFQQHPQTWNVKHDGSGNRSYVTFVFRYRSREFLLSQGIMPAGDALQLPSAVRQACVMTRRVASAPHQASNSILLTPSALIRNNSGRMSSALRNAFNPGSVPVRPATNVRTVSMKTAGRANQYPGVGIIDFTDPDNEDVFRMEKWMTKDQQ